MARKVRDSNLETRSARGRLKVAAKPFFRLIEPGLHLGYRRLASGPGTWCVRRYGGKGRYTVENIRAADGGFVVADDFSDADGVRVLTFGQAQERAKADRRAGDSLGPLTVKAAVELYLAAKREDGRDVTDATYKAEAHIYPTLGDVVCSALTTDQLRKWHRGIASGNARLRTAAGKTQKYRAADETDKDRARRRQASANRIRTILFAALNHAFHEGRIETDAAWRRVKPFKGVATARLRYLTVAECKRLLNSCDPDFRKIVMAALQTGARYGQIARLTVDDFNPDSGTVRFSSAKGDGVRRAFHCKLTSEGAAFFKDVCAGRAGTELMFTRSDRAWQPSEQGRRMREACEHAKIKPPISFHGLRHTWASAAVMAGVPLLVVAKNLGHSDTRMTEAHYGHLAPGYVADQIEAGAPRFGFKPSNIERLERRR